MTWLCWLCASFRVGNAVTTPNVVDPLVKDIGGTVNHAANAILDKLGKFDGVETVDLPPEEEEEEEEEED